MRSSLLEAVGDSCLLLTVGVAVTGWRLTGGVAVMITGWRLTGGVAATGWLLTVGVAAIGWLLL